jgi:hypothetical protein
MSTAPNSDFWQRVGLNEADGARCLQFVQERYSGCQVEEFKEQGYCSFTCLVTYSIAETGKHGIQIAHGAPQEHGEEASLIVQIRPPQHALDMGTGRAAKETYPSLAPAIQVLDLNLPGQLCAYEMQKMRGTPLSRLLPRTRNVDSTFRTKQERLVSDFATLIAQSWSSSFSTITAPRYIRADSPMDQDPKTLLLKCTGKVGSSILYRLEKLGNELPDPGLRHIAKTTLATLQAMDSLPVVLNHGDLIPSNILVDEDTWAITGLVDWAEAENLPFGTCLYGLEHLLGYISTVSQEASQGDDSTLGDLDVPVFVYCDYAFDLRDVFWSRLCELVPHPEMRREDVKVTRDLGVLLWYGYAWDDGAIDRVINETDDKVEVACLRSFLNMT